MGLTRYAIERPFITALLTVALLVAGVVSWRRLPVDLNPQADLPNVSISIIYPGASPSTVESLVAAPLEDALRGVNGVLHLYTVSQESYLHCFVEFTEGTDVAAALPRCREAFESIRGTLPAELQDPVFRRLDINAQPVLFLGLSGARPLAELRRLADQQLRPRLRAVAGVGEVSLLGGRTAEVQVDLDRERLLAAQLTLSQVLEPLQAAGRNVPAGNLSSGDRERAVRVVGEFTSLDDLRQVPLPPRFDPASLLALRRPLAGQPTRPLRLGDLGTITLGSRDDYIRIRLQQQPAVGLIVTKQGRANTVQVSAEVRAAVAAAGLPADVEVRIARDTAGTVHEALSDVNLSILLGVVLCSSIIYVFLRNWRGTVIVGTSIPVCLIGTFALIGFGDSTLNQMSLLGLALSVGILVDDSIVCLEAITWRLQRGEPPALAAFNGRNDIALADTSTTLVDLAVFLPIAVMQGVVGQFFQDFGLVVAAAAALSLLVAYTLVPMLAAVWYTRHPLTAAEQRPPEGYGRLESRYRAVLEVALRHRWRTIAGGWSVLAAAGLLAYRALGVDFIPAADLSTIVVNVELPAGATPAATERVVAAAEAQIAAVPEVATLFTTLGRIEAGFGVVSRYGPSYAQINVTLRDRRDLLDRLLGRRRDGRRRSDAAVAAEVRQFLRPQTQARWQVIAVKGWGGAGAPVDLSLYGHDLEAMSRVGEDLLRRLDSLPQLLDADVAWRLGQPELQVRLKRREAGEVSAYPGSVGRELRAALEGDTSLTARVAGELLPVRLRLQEFDRRSPADLERLPVAPGAGRVARLAEVAEVRLGTGPTRIDRRDGLRELNFKAYLAEGVSLGEARAAITAVLAELGIAPEDGPPPVPQRHPDLRWGWRGDAATMAASAKYMAATALLGALLVYGIMAALFNSAIHPLTIMLSVPMAIAGALLALVVTRSTLSIVAGIGLILLLGIVVRNAILLVDHTIHLRREGLPRGVAVLESGARRLRPILMTTAATVCGMLPVALKIGKGAEIRAPMAIAVIGGLLLSTLLTLLIVPVTYTIFDDWCGGSEDSQPTSG